MHYELYIVTSQMLCILLYYFAHGQWPPRTRAVFVLIDMVRGRLGALKVGLQQTGSTVWLYLFTSQ